MTRARAEHSPPTDASHAGSPWPGLRYGDLEAMLVELSGGDPKSVLGRFRNLRQIPFPDAIRIGTGNRVAYNLPRVLALCSAFELNSLLIPQSHAVAVVQAIWPELVRGYIAAAVELGMVARPQHMPRGLSATVAVLPDGFASTVQPVATARLLEADATPERDAGASAILIDCARIMGLIARHLEATGHDPDGAASAFGELDRSFGWSPGAVPHRASASELLQGANFLDQGPYFERADAFLRLAAPLISAREENTPVRGRSRVAAQQLLDYFGRPAPIDEWKGEIGTAEGRPRLKHQLAAIGALAGLQNQAQWPDVVLSSPLEEATATIAEALRLERKAREEWIEKAKISAAAARTTDGASGAKTASSASA